MFHVCLIPCTLLTKHLLPLGVLGVVLVDHVVANNVPEVVSADDRLIECHSTYSEYVLPVHVAKAVVVLAG